MTAIHTNEVLVTHALAAEIRHDPAAFVAFLEERAGRRFGTLLDVECEVFHKVEGRNIRLDVQLTFDGHVVDLEGKFDHQLTRQQVADQLAMLGDAGTMFVIVAETHQAPMWLTGLPVTVITWAEALDQFRESRLHMQDVRSVRTMKAETSSWLARLDVPARLPADWTVFVDRNGNGLPVVTIQSPQLSDGTELRGQIEVDGRSMPDNIDDVRFNTHVGVSTVGEDFYDPDINPEPPRWALHLRVLHDEVLAGNEQRLFVSMSIARPASKKNESGKWKMPLARLHLDGLLHLAKGYTPGWALGPKSVLVPREQLEDITSAAVEMLIRWYEAETRG